MDQISAYNMMKSIVPITRFNKGEASKIFDEVENTGTKIVIKNNKPACVLMSPAKYESLMEIVSDILLLEEAERRMADKNNEKTHSFDEVMSLLDLTRDDLDDIDVEVE